jgi:hypothetical protein
VEDGVADGATDDVTGERGASPASVDLLSLSPGHVAGLVGVPGYGLTRMGLAMLAGHARHGPVAYVDVRGWLCPSAAWEVGIPAERLVIIRCHDLVQWGRVVATLLDGMRALYAEIPRGAKDAALRKLAALARTRRTPLILRSLDGGLPSGVVHLRFEGRRVEWHGAERGHGRLASRRSIVVASGKAMRGMSREIEVEDHGADAVHLVSGMGVAERRRATG